MLAAIAVGVTAAYHLANIEKDSHCYSTNSRTYVEANPAYTDVSLRFTQIIQAYFALACVDVFRSSIMLIAHSKKVKALAIFYQILGINELFGLAVFIANHVYRFTFSGRNCAGDYLDASSSNDTLTAANSTLVINGHRLLDDSYVTVTSDSVYLQ